MKELLYKVFLQSPTNLFDKFIIECQSFYEKPAHTLQEIKQRDNKKIKGDIFEEFCLLYLKNIKNYDNVWLLKDVPDDILNQLKMVRNDMGIDIIVEHNNLFYAVQCKYKKPNTFRKNILSWKQLSTFYALCLRTGPFEKYIIMTNCDYTRHQGSKTYKDISICLKTFQNCTKDEWLKMCDKEGQIINNEINPEINAEIINNCLTDREKLRELRIKYYNGVRNYKNLLL